mmetsp:Transcript_13686/g.26193  ORF Transcript_13686/g.26193 Transcript_13686/m.26193 type:complete len:173 (-) Transcript_13686:216-734(-)
MSEPSKEEVVVAQEPIQENETPIQETPSKKPRLAAAEDTKESSSIPSEEQKNTDDKQETSVAKEENHASDHEDEESPEEDDGDDDDEEEDAGSKNSQHQQHDDTQRDTSEAEPFLDEEQGLEEQGYGQPGMNDTNDRDVVQQEKQTPCTVYVVALLIGEVVGVVIGWYVWAR